MASAFCRTAPSVRFRDFATLGTGVFALEYALSSRTSSFVQGLRAGVVFFGISFRSIFGRSLYVVLHQAQPMQGLFECLRRFLIALLILIVSARSSSL